MLETKEYRARFCVIGGGLAGICAAVAAAREGISVILMHDRPMLGGNASSEIRMWVCGAQAENKAETGILEELFQENLRMNPYKLYPVFDSLLYGLVRREKNITLLLNCSCMAADTKDDTVLSVTGWQMTTQRFCKVYADYFADCSGDSILAPITGARFRVGREAPSEFGENVSIREADKKTMGNSCLIQAHKTDRPIRFTAPDFAKKITDRDVRFRTPCLDCESENFWYLELGGDRDTIADAEEIGEELIALAYGMWDHIKNSGNYAGAEFWQLDFIGYLPGKRESRRMTGKVTVTQNDILEDRAFEDTVAYGGWPLDDHDPAGFYYDGHPNTSYNTPPVYAIPYRALYSENITNLFFAGRNISMTHAAMSSSRVMGTCALCGQAVGTAAAIAAKYAVSPDGVYRGYLPELQETLLWNDCMLPHIPRSPQKLSAASPLTLNEKYNAALETLRDGDDRENVLECDFGDELSYTFPSPVPLKEIRIVFDSDLRRKTLPGGWCERTHMTRCNLLPDSPVMCSPSTLCERFLLRVTDASGRVFEKEYRENTRRLVKETAASLLGVDNTAVSSVTLIPLSAWSGGKKARLFSWEVR